MLCCRDGNSDDDDDGNTPDPEIMAAAAEAIARETERGRAKRPWYETSPHHFVVCNPPIVC